MSTSDSILISFVIIIFIFLGLSILEKIVDLIVRIIRTRNIRSRRINPIEVSREIYDYVVIINPSESLSIGKHSD
tara:strand:+ start:822 stop:1046 length:225 start_codon:yes stop_codon:yes gene_type:complete